MFQRQQLESVFSQALPYEAYTATGRDGDRAAWQRIFDQAHLAPEQAAVVRGFTRDMNVLVVSGMWCGDCAQQCPLLERIALANPQRITVRFVDRDEQRDLAQHLKINGGDRVPVALFMAEDFELCGIFGDRTLTRYRALSARMLGAACPLPGSPVPAGELAATLAEWLNEFERFQLMLRLSGRLRQKHGD